MTVAELIEVLRRVQPDKRVVVATESGYYEPDSIGPLPNDVDREINRETCVLLD